MNTLLTVVIIALVVVAAVAVIPSLLGRRKPTDEAPTTRSNLGGPQEEKIADQARPSQSE